MMKYRFYLSAMLLLLILSGCGTAPNGGKPTPTQEIYQPTRSVATVPAPTEAPACNNILAYTEYEDLYNEVLTAPGEKFTVSWEVMNYGDCIWDENYHLYFISGDQMGAPDYVDIPRVPIGSKTKIMLTLTAPDASGEYRSEWKMFGKDNRFFGDSLIVEVTVQ